MFITRKNFKNYVQIKNHKIESSNKLGLKDTSMFKFLNIALFQTLTVIIALKPAPEFSFPVCKREMTSTCYLK